MSSLPVKLITSPEKLQEFQKTATYESLIRFVVDLQKAVVSKPIPSVVRHPEFKVYDDYLVEIGRVLEVTPPTIGKNRFGNLAFRDFYDRIQSVNETFVNRLLTQLMAPLDLAPQLKVYLDESYGDKMRVDYGTGHELNFMIFLFCVNKVSPFAVEQHQAVVQEIFYDYIFVMRKIQLQYNLEPAGSHGVWGLDDYHFLPFIFGGAELINHESIKSPKAIRDPVIVEQYKDEFMYMNCIAFIRQVKKGVGFAETSPILNDIAEAANWEKVAGGMVKMYMVEVFGKFPVVQHIKFGKLFEFK